jgi:hypothetical protein
MRAHRRLAVRATTLIAVAMLTTALAAATAAAGRFELPRFERGFVLAFANLEFTNGLSLTTRCPAGFTGQFEARTFSKTAGTTVGRITQAQITDPDCQEGRASVVPTSLPWTVRYSSFTGTLPNITGVRLVVPNAEMTIETNGLGVTCTATTSPEEPAAFIANVTVEGSGELVISSIRADESARIDLLGGRGLCAFAGPGWLIGTGLVTEVRTATSVWIRLI